MAIKLCPMTFPSGKPEKCNPLDCAWFLEDRCAIVRIEEGLRKNK